MALKDELHSKRYELADLLDEYEELSGQRERLTDVASKVKVDRKLAKLGDSIMKLQDEVDSMESAHKQAEIERARPLARQAVKECEQLFERETQAMDELLAAWQLVYEKTGELHQAALDSRDAWLEARDLCWQAGEQPPKVPDFSKDTIVGICEMKNEYQAKFTPAYEFCINKIRPHELSQHQPTRRAERRDFVSIRAWGE